MDKIEVLWDYSRGKTEILWDRAENEPATNWDGTAPEIENGIVYIKDLGCNCNPADACGGCIDITNAYKLGDRFYLREIL